MSRARWISLAILLPHRALAQDGRCRLDVQPAAALLLPTFEVDLDHPARCTTLFSVANAVAPGQAWVAPLHSAAQRFSVGLGTLALHGAGDSTEPPAPH